MKNLQHERLLSVALLTAVFLWLWIVLVPPGATYRSNLHIDRFWLHKVFGPERYDLVVAGDSRIYRGISTDDLSAELYGLSAYNLGFSSGILDKDLLELAQHKLAPDGARLLLLGITPHALTAKRNEHLAKIAARSLEDRILVRYGHPLALLFHRMSPTTLLKLIAGHSVWSNQTNYLEDYFIESGWVASSYRREYGNKATLRTYRETRERFPVSPQRVADLLAAVAELHRTGVRVFFLWLPSSPPMQKLETAWPGFDYSALREALRSAGAVPLDHAVPIGLHSYDGSHLHHSSARTLSRSLGRALAEAMEMRP